MRPFSAVSGALELALHPEAQVDRHLVVARACGMQAARRGADQLGKPRLDIHVDVFEAGREFELAGFDLYQNRVQPVSDLLLIGRRNNARFRQHFGMGERAAYILRVELPVEADRGVDRFHDGGRTRGKTSAPHLVAGLLLAHGANRVLEISMANGKLKLPATRLIVAGGRRWRGCRRRRGIRERRVFWQQSRRDRRRCRRGCLRRQGRGREADRRQRHRRRRGNAGCRSAAIAAVAAPSTIPTARR